MPEALQRTCWRGIEIGHPAEWELALLSGVDEPCRLTFVDRCFQRLDVRWRPLDRAPNLQGLLKLHTRRAKDPAAVSAMSDLPADWCGLLRRGDEGQVVHAGRFFEADKLLVEVSLIWPEGRPTELERQILNSVAPQPADAPRREWRALGLDVELGRAFELRSVDTAVGQVRWEFGRPGRAEEVLKVSRLALAEHWLAGSVRAWLESELDEGSRLLWQRPGQINGHPSQALASQRKAGKMAALRGRRRVTLAVAWQCPRDGRVYHVAWARTQSDEAIDWPDGLHVACCRPVPTVGVADAGAAR